MAQPRSVREQVGLDPSPEELAAREALAAEEAAAAEAEAQAAERPDFLADKFATVEDQARAYTEAQKALGRKEKELGDLRDQLAEFALSQDQEPQPAFQQPGLEQNPWLAQLEAAWENGDMRTVAAINLMMLDARTQQTLQAYAEQNRLAGQPQAEALGEIIVAQAETAVAAEYGQAWTDEFRAEIGDLIEQHPQLVPEGADLAQTTQALRLAAELVASRRGGVEPQGVSQAMEERQRKLMAQTASGGAGRVVTQANPADALVEQMRSLRSAGYAQRG